MNVEAIAGLPAVAFSHISLGEFRVAVGCGAACCGKVRCWNRSGREHYSEPEEAAMLTARTGVNHRYGAAPDCGI